MLHFLAIAAFLLKHWLNVLRFLATMTEFKFWKLNNNKITDRVSKSILFHAKLNQRRSVQLYSLPWFCSCRRFLSISVRICMHCFFSFENLEQFYDIPACSYVYAFVIITCNNIESDQSQTKTFDAEELETLASELHVNQRLGSLLSSYFRQMNKNTSCKTCPPVSLSFIRLSKWL